MVTGEQGYLKRLGSWALFTAGTRNLRRNLGRHFTPQKQPCSGVVFSNIAGTIEGGSCSVDHFPLFIIFIF